MAIDLPRVRAVLFDFDGTLSDTDDAYVARMARLLRFLKEPERGRVARRLVMEMEAPGNLAFSAMDRLGLDNALRWVTRQLRRGRVGERKTPNPPVPGVPEMLARLAPHYALALVSTRGRPMVDAFLEKYRLAPWFGSVVTAETCFRAKPAPDPLLHAARELGFEPEACVMVGDTTVDMRAARAAGTQAIGVLCGFGEEAELRRSGAGFILPSTADLTAVL